MVERDGFILPAFLAAVLVFPAAAACQESGKEAGKESGRGWRAGAAAVDITPEGPIWLAGYAARRKPSESVAQPIFAKALALEPAGGPPLVAVATDLLGLPRPLAERVAARIGDRFRLSRERVLLAASHSHSAPVIADRLVGMYFLEGENRERVEAYTRAVEEKLFEAAARALENLRPARLSYGHGRADFARNRRRVNPDDPADHDVPLLAVEMAAAAGSPPRRAVLFAYACHNTTLQGHELCGDYAGFAQGYLEEDRPGLTALFLSGCGGDANPEPRGEMEHARAHGRALADAVGRVLDGSGSLEPLGAASAAAAFTWADLPLSPVPPRAEIEKQLEDQNRYVQVRARRLLDLHDSGEGIPTSYPLAVQAWRLGANEKSSAGGFTLIAIAGEVVVDYALRLKRELGSRGLMVAAYANDCPAYIPSERVLREGGYEGAGAMLYYGFHGPWAPGVEERVMRSLHEVIRRAGGGRFSATPGGITAPGAKLERVWTGGAFTEGPAAGAAGEVTFTDIPNLRIVRVSADGSASVHREPSGRANGLILDREGRLIACEGAAPGGGRRVVRYERDGAVTVLAERFDGKRLNSPNDIAIDSRGRIWFSDPRYAGDEQRELERESVYRIDAPGEVRLAIADVVKPNGLAFSPDGGTLYVSDTAPARLYAYRVDAEGNAERERIVFDFSPGRGIDGMEVDQRGVILGAAGQGELSGVYAISPAGELLEFIPVPETATNCAFGGAGGRTLFITAGGSLYKIRARTPGHVLFPPAWGD